MPALILPTGDVLYEANVVMQYINDKYSDIGPHVGAFTPEERARAALLTQIHDLYIASPNSSDPKVTANQGAMYKPVDVIDATSRAGKLLELNKQLDVIEGLIVGPYAAGEHLTVADLTMFPTLGVFFPVMLPFVFGWRNPMDNDTRPRLKAWFQKMSALPAAERVRAEIKEALASWESSGRFTPIIEQVAANPNLQWIP